MSGRGRDSRRLDELMQHEAGESGEVQPSDRVRQAFIVPRQPTKAGSPGETTQRQGYSANLCLAAVSLTTSRSNLCAAAAVGSAPM